mmetsp:Transcript_32480/g.55168  ORF Transcript_32480/g.55168 Transcript_32480/m.55168 type:complete len:150 (+) Transcript_32480:489-938(+)
MIGITRYKEDIIIWASIECVKEDSGMLKTTPSKRERIPTIASPIPSGYANSFIALVIFAWNVAVEFRVDPTNIAPLLPLLLLLLIVISEELCCHHFPMARMVVEPPPAATLATLQEEEELLLDAIFSGHWRVLGVSQGDDVLPAAAAAP